ncbi:hypothetical protein [Microbacterium sp. SA39]|uniref:hypothetical protein n=1 Tax=Microbacterium sp. SA39 TaxID=1263625 RepID=UPI001F40BB36|nr:hypothetical protein [Microbacterium sp. SA39]
MLLTSETVLHALDYGQFTITGGALMDDIALLADALRCPPTASDGRSVLVLSPHQNDFAMTVSIERWSDRPTHDESGWDQISVERLSVGATATVRLGSPTLEDTECTVPAGDYWVEVSGRGFVNYGWPGSTEPGDEWRLRLWPVTARTEEVRTLWQMPGHGCPWNADD